MLQARIANDLTISSRKEAPYNMIHELRDKLRSLEVLIVFDNCDMILATSNQSKAFREFISVLLGECQQLKLLFTSRSPIGNLDSGTTEKILTVPRLQREDSAALLSQRAPRQIPIEEKMDLLQLPHSQTQNIKKRFEEHELFTILDDIPHSIILSAALLDNHFKLKDL